MYELLAIAVGISVGAGWSLTASRPGRMALVVAGLLGAAGAFALSGEVELSPAFLLWDLSQVIIAAALTAYLARRLAGPNTGRLRRR